MTSTGSYRWDNNEKETKECYILHNYTTIHDIYDYTTTTTTATLINV
jgi:hypothetical protein